MHYEGRRWLKSISAAGALWMQDTNRFSSFAARALLALLIVAPFILLSTHKPNLALPVWTITSLWAALDAGHLTILAFPERHSLNYVFGVTLLAVANIAASV